MDKEGNMQENMDSNPDKNPEVVQPEVVESKIENESKSVEESAETKEANIEAVEEDKGPEENPEIVAESSEDEEANEAEEPEIEEEEIDYSHASKEDLLKALNELKDEEIIRTLDKHLKEIKPAFDEQYELAKNEALQAFITEGNEAAAFDYHGDEIDKQFFSLYGELRGRRNKHFKELENQKEQNLTKKEALLDQLREIVDGEESASSINGVREIQAEWKKVGAVPGAVMNKTLWANYNALLDRYYDNRGIYFELKDLDRKKNKAQKEALIAKAETLANQEDLKAAVMELNDLHEEYKHIGPVPKEDQEPLWQKFKAASDQIYDRRKDHFDQLKEEFDANLIKKDALIEKVKSLVDFSSERITEWNQKTKELLDIQKEWEAIGGVPREKIKITNKSFWNAFKGFFANKNRFFKTLEAKKGENLEAKKALVVKALELKDSDDLMGTADKLKDLQTQWKDIGPVPDKDRNQIYTDFKAACDHFFDRRREQNKEVFKEQDENLKAKMDICDELEKKGTGETVDLDELYDLIDAHNGIGFVPKKAIKKSRKRFEVVRDKILANEAIGEYDREDLKNHISTSRLRNSAGGAQKVNRKEQTIRRKISHIEGDVSTWKTNIEFFASSATADKLKEDLQQKIDHAQKEIESLKSELSALTS